MKYSDFLFPSKTHRLLHREQSAIGPAAVDCLPVSTSTALAKKRLKTYKKLFFIRSFFLANNFYYII